MTIGSDVGRSEAVRSGTGKGPATAIGLTLAAVALFAVMDNLVKWAGGTYAIAQIILFRSFFAFVPLAWPVFTGGGWAAVQTGNLMSHVVRSLVGLLAMGSIFYSLTVMKLADVVAITFAAPVFATALSVPMLAERVGLRRWIAVVIGFVGVLVIVRPGSTAFETVSLVAVLGAGCIGMTTVYVRKMTRTETIPAIVFYFTLTTATC